MEMLQGDLNFIITSAAGEARAAAPEADLEIQRGHYRGPLHGVPVTIKDLFMTAGLRTTGGSKILAEWIPDYDAAIVEQLRRAGAIIVGKTNLDEFGHGGTSTVSYFGPVHNPWNLDRIAGGSRGGSTAAVSAGVGPLSFGTETGTSVRRPAAYCGVFGFRPTLGLVSRHGSLRTAWSLDQAGVFARSVEDAAAGLDAITGYDERDPASVAGNPPAFASNLDTATKGVRVGVPRAFLGGLQTPVAAAFEKSLKILAEQGSEIVEIDMPELRYTAMTSALVTSAEAAGYNYRWIHERLADYMPEVRPRLAAGLAISAAEYFTLQRARQKISLAFSAIFEAVDVVANPTTGRVAPRIADGPQGNGDLTYAVSNDHANLLRFPSLLGLPACSVPSGLAPDGLPLALQLAGAPFSDQQILNLALSHQRRCPWPTLAPTSSSLSRR